MIFLDQAFHARSTQPAQMDELWAAGWRHFGSYFFRYSLAQQRGGICHVIPLRVELSQFTPSRSQKRILAKNRDANVVIRETFIDAAKEELFQRHRQRFKENVPASLYSFLSRQPSRVPCHNREICVYEGERLLAASFLDLGATATSAVYAMFEPAKHKRSLGIFTMLKAIEHSRALGCRYYYPGYAFREPSVYDYKKNFAGLQYLDWEAGWLPYNKEATATNQIETYFGEL
jgi:arginine-tRNA-protein transferase